MHRDKCHGRYEAGLRGLRGHRGRGLTEGLVRFAWHFKMGDWLSEADGLCEAGLCDLRGHRSRRLTEGLGRSLQASGRVPSERGDLTTGALAVAAEGSRLRVIRYMVQYLCFFKMVHLSFLITSGCSPFIARQKIIFSIP